MPDRAASAVSVGDLRVHFPIRKGVMGAVAGQVRAVDGVSFDIAKNETFALVGESGCGKTTVAHAVLHLLRPTTGTITIAAGPWSEHGTAWDALSPEQRRSLRKHIQVIFQDPYSSLSPRLTVRKLLEEPLIVHHLGSAAERHDRVIELLQQVGLSADFLNRYPHEFSGGQRQRIGIARALATRPSIVIADEPVSALDVSIQAQIINLLQDLKEQYRQTLLFISHDLALVRHIADRVAVMYLGRIMEMGAADNLFASPLHPYTQLLLDSVPRPGEGRKRGALPTEEKSTADARAGCPFYPRCQKHTPECLRGPVDLREVGGRLVACVNA